MATRTITYSIRATNVAMTGFRRAETAIVRLGRTAYNTTKSIRSYITKMGISIAQFGVKAVATLGTVAVAMGGFALKMATDAEEVENKFKIVFSNMSTEANDWINTYSQTVGRSRFETKKLISDTQDLLTGFGATAKQGFEYSKMIQSLGVDLASFNNLQDEDAVVRLRKGLLGEHENLKELGIIINEATLNQEALNQGYANGYKDLDEFTKIQLRYSIAVRQSKNAIGDAEGSMMSLTNQTKAMKSNFIDTITIIGSFFIPGATKIVSFINSKFATAFDFVQTKLTPRIEQFTVVAGILFRLLRYMGDEIVKSLGIKKLPIGDAILSAFSGATNILEAFTMLLFNNKEGIIDFVVTSVQKLSNFISKIIELGDNLGIFKLLNMYVKFQTNNYKILFGVLMQLPTIVQNVFSIVKDYISANFLPVFKQIFDRVIQFTSVVMENIPRIKEIFMDVFNTITTYTMPLFMTILNELIQNILPSLIDNILNIAERIIPMFISAFELAWTIIKRILILLSAAFIALWPLISKVFTDIVTMVSEKVTSFITIIDGLLQFLTGIFTANWSKAWNGIKLIFTGVFENMFASVKPQLNDIIKKINFILTGFNNITSKVPFMKNIKIPSIPQFANGTNYAPGGLSLVGEKGAELVNLPRGSQVINNNNTSRILNNSKGASNVNVTINVNGTQDTSNFVQKVKTPLKRELENIFRSLNSEMGLEG